MREFIAYVFITLVAYLAGFGAYVVALDMIWNQSLGKDIYAVLYWDGMIFVAVAVPIYAGVIYVVDKKFPTYKGLLYPLGCIAVFFLPTWLIMIDFGSVNIFSPEAVLFYALYIASGFVFGVGSWVFRSTLRAN